MSNQQPATSNQQPATSNQQPATSNQQPATSNQQPATSNQQPATRSALDISSHSPDALTLRQQELLAAIRQIAPEIASDQQIDFVRLRDLLGHDRIAPAKEHYELTWAGKAAARREIQQATSATLLPAPGNPAAAAHMLIEGENLEVLRILQKSYYGRVKMIYIDPPYNTGNDSFVYPDDFSERLAEYQRRTGGRDADGLLNRDDLWRRNTKENGHYHSAWLSMMYTRLYLARNLLRDDGVIFISIDDNEAANLKLLCDEIFGEENFVAQIIWKKRSTPPNDKLIGAQHEYIFCYAKRLNELVIHLRKRSEAQLARYQNPDGHPKGVWMPGDLMANIKGGRYVESLYFPIINPRTGQAHYPSSNGNWRFNQERIEELLSNNEIYFGEDDNGRPKLKRFLCDVKEGVTWTSLWDFAPLNTSGSSEIADLLGSMSVFENPKPTGLLTHILQAGSATNDIVLDFFAGSGTTMQAVMELNLEDGGSRQCICVQIPEKLDEKTEAYKAGYRTIADITRARIDKVIAKLKAEYPDTTQNLACAQFTLSPSHFRQWRSDVAGDALREQLALFRQSEAAAPQTPDAQRAMLAELLLKMGLGALGVQAISRADTLAGVTVHRVSPPGRCEVWFCFEPYQDALKDAIAQQRPAQVVMLNSCFVGDKADEQLANLQLELQALDMALTLV